MAYGQTEHEANIELQRRNEGLQKRLRLQEAELRLRQQRLTQALKAAEDVSQRLESTEAERQGLEVQVAELTSELHEREKVAEGREQLLSELRAQKAVLEDSLDNLRDIHARCGLRLSTEEHKLLTDNMRMEQQLGEKNTRVAVLEETQRHLRQRLAETSGQLSDKERQLLETSAQLEDLQLQHDVAVRDRDKHGRTVERLNKERRAARNRHAQDVAQLKEKREELKREVSELANKVKKQKRRVKEHQESMRRKTHRYANLNSSHTQLMQDLKQLQDAHTTAAEEARSERRARESAEQRWREERTRTLKEAERAMLELQQRLKDQEEAHAVAKENSERALEQLKMNARTAEERLKAAEATDAQHQAELRAQKEAVELELSQAREAKDQAEMSLSQQSAEYADACRERDEWQALSHEWQRKFKAASVDLQTLAQREDQSKSAVEEKQRLLNEAEGRHQETVESLMAQRAEHVETAGSLEEARTQHKELLNKLKVQGLVLKETQDKLAALQAEHRLRLQEKEQGLQATIQGLSGRVVELRHQLSDQNKDENMTKEELWNWLTVNAEAKTLAEEQARAAKGQLESVKGQLEAARALSHERAREVALVDEERSELQSELEALHDTYTKHMAAAQRQLQQARAAGYLPAISGGAAPVAPAAAAAAAAADNTALTATPAGAAPPSNEDAFMTWLATPAQDGCPPACHNPEHAAKQQQQQQQQQQQADQSKPDDDQQQVTTSEPVTVELSDWEAQEREREAAELAELLRLVEPLARSQLEASRPWLGCKVMDGWVVDDGSLDTQALFGDCELIRAQRSSDDGAVVVVKPQLGFKVTDVDADGPAAAAGMRAGDWITAINGAPANRKTDLYAAFKGCKPGSVLTLQLERRPNGECAEARLMVGCRELPTESMPGLARVAGLPGATGQPTLEDAYAAQAIFQ